MEMLKMMDEPIQIIKMLKISKTVFWTCYEAQVYYKYYRVKK